MRRFNRSVIVTVFWVLYSAVVAVIPPVTIGVGAVAVLTSCKKKAQAVNNVTTPTVQPGTPTVGQPQ